MKNNSELQKAVQEAIEWEPLLHAAEIGVTAKDGTVTLTGTVDCYAKKSEAEDAAKSVDGVKAVIEKIEVKFGDYGKTTDTEIATEVLNALAWSWRVPHDRIQVRVEDGWVTLDGEVTWNYQREAAGNAVNNLRGVKGVFNKTKIKSESNDAIEAKEIEKAFERNWAIKASDITVGVSGTNVTLTGKVASGYQKDEAEKIAWKAPGVCSVENTLKVVYDYSFVD